MNGFGTSLIATGMLQRSSIIRSTAIEHLAEARRVRHHGCFGATAFWTRACAISCSVRITL